MADFEITFDPDGHKYAIDGEPVPSVTQILSVLDKPLTWWAQGIGVEGVCQLQRAGENLSWEDPEGIVKLLTTKRLTVNHQRDKGGTRGTSLHDALEAYLTRGAIPNAADVPESDRGYVQALARALLKLRPEPIEAEVIVGSKQHGFAGKFDVLAMVDGAVTRLDLKTGKRVYDEAHLQLAAYELAAVECDRQASEVRAVIHLSADGEFEFVKTVGTAQQFLAVKSAYDAMRALKAALKPKRQAKAAA